MTPRAQCNLVDFLLTRTSFRFNLKSDLRSSPNLTHDQYLFLYVHNRAQSAGNFVSETAVGIDIVYVSPWHKNNSHGRGLLQGNDFQYEQTRRESNITRMNYTLAVTRDEKLNNFNRKILKKQNNGRYSVCHSVEPTRDLLQRVPVTLSVG